MPATAPAVLLRARHDAQTTLTAPLAPGQASLTVASAAPFAELPVGGLVLDATTGTHEVVSVDSLTSGLTYACTRGLDGTAAGGFTFPVGASVEVVQTAEHWRRLLRAWTEKLAGTVNAYEYGARADGVTDDTAPLQAALDAAAAAAGGGVVQLPAGQYRLTNTLTFGACVTLRGVHGGASVGLGQPKDAGTAFLWDGPEGVPMLRGTDVYQAQVEGITFDARAVPGVTGLQLVVGPAGGQAMACRLLGLNFYDCPTAILLTGSGPGARVQQLWIQNLHVRNDAPGLQDLGRGIVVLAPLAAHLLHVEHAAIQVVNVGVDLQSPVEQVELRRVVFGALGGPHAVGVRLGLATDPPSLPPVAVLLAICQSEGGTDDCYMLDLQGSPTTEAAIVLWGNRVDELWRVGHQRRIVSLGNYATEQAICSVPATTIVSIQDRLHGGTGWTVTPAVGLTVLQGASVQLATGTPFTGFLNATTVPSWGAIPALGSGTATVSVPGVLGGDTLVATPEAGLDSHLALAAAFVSAPDQVQLRLANLSPTLSVTPSAGRPWRIDSWRH